MLQSSLGYDNEWTLKALRPVGCWTKCRVNKIKWKEKCSDERSKRYDIICISYNILLFLPKLDYINLLKKIMKFASSTVFKKMISTSTLSSVCRQWQNWCTTHTTCTEALSIEWVAGPRYRTLGIGRYPIQEERIFEFRQAKQAKPVATRKIQKQRKSSSKIVAIKKNYNNNNDDDKKIYKMKQK